MTEIERYISNIVGLDVRVFVDNYIEFIQTRVSSITAFYEGATTYDEVVFSELQDQLSTVNLILERIGNNNDKFNRFSYWNMLSSFEDIKSALLTVSNSFKWLRSSLIRGQYSNKTSTEIQLVQNQSIEQLVSRLGSENPQNDWFNLAIKNDLKEEDYTEEGGVLLTVELQSTFDFFLNSVVDTMLGENVYGKELDKKLQFDTANQDLLILTPQKSFLQAVDILAGLRKGDNPISPEEGVSSKLIVGSNVGSVGYPSIFRQLSQVFKTDDTIKSFAVKNVSIDQDSLSIEYQVESRIGDIEQKTVLI